MAVQRDAWAEEEERLGTEISERMVKLDEAREAASREPDLLKRQAALVRARMEQKVRAADA